MTVHACTTAWSHMTFPLLLATCTLRCEAEREPWIDHVVVTCMLYNELDLINVGV